jgi:hypothetical protein
MMRLLLIVLVVLTLGTGIAESAQFEQAFQLPANIFAVQAADSINADSLWKLQRSTLTEEKSAGVALALAIMPGVLIHGLGHAYLGDRKTFGRLFMPELICIPVVVMTEHAKSGHETSPVSVLAGVVFAGTWLYDVIGAPIKAHKLNAKNEKLITMVPTKIHNTYGIALALSFGN